MAPFPLDRTHPPSRVVYRDAARQFVLRPWTFGDIDALIAAVAASGPALREFMPWAHLPMTREGQYDLVAKFQAEYWAGREYVVGVFGADGAVLGGAGLHPRVPLNPRGLEVGYWCHSAHAGRGLTTHVVRALALLALERFDCDRFQVMHDEANVASRRVAEKCGFVYEGTQRNVTGEVAPAVRAGGFRGTGRHRMYGLTREDLAAQDWAPAVRAATTLHDALGQVYAGG